MGLGCLDVLERGCERLAAMCVMARRGVLERELEEHESAVLFAANYLRRRKCPFHAGLPDRLHKIVTILPKTWKRQTRALSRARNDEF